MNLSQTHRPRTLTKGESCDRGHPRPPGTPLPARPPNPPAVSQKPRRSSAPKTFRFVPPGLAAVTLPALAEPFHG